MILGYKGTKNGGKFLLLRLRVSFVAFVVKYMNTNQYLKAPSSTF